MFDFFRKHTWLLKVILAFVVLAFVGGGVYQGYGSFMNGESATVAEVDGRAITRPEWEEAQREQLERIRARAPNVDPKLFDTPEMKRQSLDAVVRERVMFAAADHLHLTVTDDRLQRLFVSDPQLAPLRNADGSVNKEAIAAQGMSSEVFAQRLRQALSLRQVTQGLGNSVIAPLGSTSAALDAMYQQREVQVQRFAAQAYAGQVSPTDADVEKFYKDPSHAADFTAPESAAVEYAVLDLESLKKSLVVPEKDLRDDYTTNLARFTVPEERRASHILVAVAANASAGDRAKAKAEAEGLLAEVTKSPAAFAELARKNSDDPGSAEKGGDLDFFGHGGLAAKPLEDAAFALKPGEIGPLVQSDFGYHVVQLTGVRGGETRSFEAVRAEIDDEVRTQLARKRFAELAADFKNIAYEQPDSLKPLADKFQIAVRSANEVHRTPATGAEGPLANPKFLEALFAADAVRDKHNTEAIEVAPGVMASGRVVRFEAAHLLPFDAVKAQARARLVAIQAAARARQLGEARLAELRAAPGTVLPEPVVVLSRGRPGDLPQPLVDAILKAPAGQLPSFVGVDLGQQGYAVAKIGKVLPVRDPLAADATRAQSQYAQAWGDAETQAYYAALKTRYKVAIRPRALSTADAPAATASASAQ